MGFYITADDISGRSVNMVKYLFCLFLSLCGMLIFFSRLNF